MKRGTKFLSLIILVGVLMISTFVGIKYLNTKSTENVFAGNPDREFYAVNNLKSAGGWVELEVTEIDGGGSRLKFQNCFYADYRTMGHKQLDLDGLHIIIENFSGDGLGVQFSNSISPSPYDDAYRLYAFNNTYGPTKFQEVYPKWGNFRAAQRMNCITMPSSIEIKVNKVESRWIINFNGQELDIFDTEMAKCIEDTTSVYVSFMAYGGQETIDNCQYDVISMHGGDQPCASYLTYEEKTAIQKAEEKIEELGLIDGSEASLRKINETEKVYNSVNANIRELVKNKDKLFSARKNHYIINNPVHFNEDNIKTDFFAISDNHIDTNGCTNYEYGTPLDRLNLSLSIMNKKKPDAVVLAGDMTDWARFTDDDNVAMNQINKFKASVINNLDEDIEIFYSLGNHDSTNSSRVNMFNDLLGERFFRTDVDKYSDSFNKGFRHAVINGYHFISVEWDYTDEQQNISLEGINYVQKTLNKITNSSTYNNEPIFFISHVPFSSGLYGCEKEVGMFNKLKLQKVLAQFPQVVVIAGHTHFPLNNDTSVFQEEFTQIATATTSYINLPGDGFIEDGGYRLGSYVYPEDLIQAQGVYVELDNESNMRISRIDFLKGGKVIYDVILLPKPDMENKTHLYYRGENLKYLNETIKFNNNDINCEKVGDNKYKISFEQATGKNVVDYNIVEFYKDGSLVKKAKAYTKNWNYPEKKDIPKVREIVIDNVVIEYPFEVKVYAVDSYDNKSQSISCNVDKITSEQISIVEKLNKDILAIDRITTGNFDKVKNIIETYENLNYEQQALVTEKERIELLKKEYYSYYTTEEQYYKNATIQNTIISDNYWIPQGWMSYEDNEKGILVNYSNGQPNVRFGLKRMNLDGTIISIDQIEKKENAKNPMIGFIFGGDKHSQFTGNEKGGFLMLLNTDNGLLELHNGFYQVIKSHKLKYETIKETGLTIKFKKIHTGEVLVDINGLMGMIPEKYFNGDYTLTDYRNTYISISCWNEVSDFSMRLLLAYEDDKMNYSQTPVLKTEMEKIDKLKNDISNLKNTSSDYKEEVLRLNEIYKTIENKELVRNYDVLENAIKEFQPEPDNNEPQQEEKGGCNSMISGVNYLAVIGLSLIFIIIKKYKIFRRGK